MFRRKSSDPETAFEVTKSEAEWKAQLPADRYAVLRRAGTEPAWSGDLLHVDGHGVFSCAACRAELFDTDAKFESGTCWPSFDRARAAGTVLERKERGFVMARTEILCARCGGHLGHVFPDWAHRHRGALLRQLALTDLRGRGRGRRRRDTGNRRRRLSFISATGRAGGSGLDSAAEAAHRRT
jgi:peptide-methionine (R)-S-oxide reductase